MASLFYKDDWDQAKTRLRAWWAHENTGRCGLWITAPRDRPLGLNVPQPLRPPTPEQHWMDLDYIAACNRWRMSRTFFGGEAFPTWEAGYPGHTTHAAYLGCAVDLDFVTGWVHSHPALAGESLDLSSLRIDRTSAYFQFQMSMLARGSVEAAGKAIVSVGAPGGCGDTLAWLRGSERLLFDVMDRPEEVRQAELFLMAQWIELYEEFFQATQPVDEGGSACWFGLWAPGRFYPTHNDFAYMISPQQFSKMFLPALERQLAYLDFAVHHVDGVGNFVHVDMLCELPRLQAIQILPGAGKPSPLHYLDVLKKVQAAGKNLHISLEAEEIEPALRELSARGLFILTQAASEAEARYYLAKAEQWSRDRR